MGMRQLQNRIMSILTAERGASLILALLLSALLFLLVTVVIRFSNTELKSASKQKVQTCSYYVAEAGLERTIRDINQKLAQHMQPTDMILQDIAFQQGSYSTSVTAKTNDYGEHIGYTIGSTGRCGQEEKTITAWVRQPVWPGNGNIPQALQFAIYAENELKLRTLSGLLGLGILSTHQIQIDGDFHGNELVTVNHDSILFAPPPPIINGYASSTALSNINVDGLSPLKEKTYDSIPMPEFDFDAARKKAQAEGIYIPHSVLDISLLGLSPSDQIIFIDGDLTLAGLDLLGISLMDKTIVVNGTITGLLEVGGNSLVNTKLNLIAKQNIIFVGALTGLQINGVLFAQKDISVGGHAEVIGYAGARNIDMGGGILSGLLGIITGNMHFNYNQDALQTIPSGVGFKLNSVEVVEQKE